MSFHHCAFPNCGGPQSHTVALAESDDAVNWNLVANFPFYQGSVPDVICRGSKLYLFTPGKVKRFDQLSQQWDANPQSVSITDSIGNPIQFVDPSAFVDDSGRLCLFFLNATGLVGDPAYCATPPCTAYFDSAVEVPGSEGTQFIKQTGHRIAYTTNTNYKPTDPDIFFHLNTYYQYISFGTGTMVYTSNTLHGNYIQVATLPNGYLTQSNAGVPCGMFNQNSGMFYSYGHRNGVNGTEITMASHLDFSVQANYNLLFTGNSIGLGNVQVASPGICINTFLPNLIDEKMDDHAIKLWPNPSDGHVMIQSKNRIKDVLIYDLTGKIIKTHLKVMKQSPSLFFDIQAGLYIVQCFDEKNEVTFTKMLIQK